MAILPLSTAREREEEWKKKEKGGDQRRRPIAKHLHRRPLGIFP
jgi:hypothetical protein